MVGAPCTHDNLLGCLDQFAIVIYWCIRPIFQIIAQGTKDGGGTQFRLISRGGAKIAVVCGSTLPDVTYWMNVMFGTKQL